MASYTPNYNLYKPAGTDQFDNFLIEFGNNMDVIDQNLGGGGGSSTLAGLSDVNLTSPTTDDALIYDGAEWVNSPLSAVAFSGDYSDLSNAPTIPTKTSDLNNDSDFVSDASYVHTDNNFTNADVTKLSGIQAGAEVNVQSDWNEADNTADDYIKNKPTIPTNTSDLNNDSGFLDSSDITVTQIQTTGTKIATIDVDGNSTDIYAPTGGGGSYTEGDGIDITSNTISVDTTFTEASTRANINSGDTFSTILGKIKKWFTDIPSLFVSKTGDTMTGELQIRRDGEVGVRVVRNNTGTTIVQSSIGAGNNIADGTVGATYGSLFLYGDGNRYTELQARNSTSNRIIQLPNENGTLALKGKAINKITDGNNSDDIIFSQTSGASSGGNKYCKLAIIEVGRTYVNGVIKFELGIRGLRTVKTLELTFAGENNTDPAVSALISNDDEITAYAVRISAGKWEVYVAFNKNESAGHYITVNLFSIMSHSQFDGTITPSPSAVQSLPVGTQIRSNPLIQVGEATLATTADNTIWYAQVSASGGNAQNKRIVATISQLTLGTWQPVVLYTGVLVGNSGFYIYVKGQSSLSGSTIKAQYAIHLITP